MHPQELLRTSRNTLSILAVLFLVLTGMAAAQVKVLYNFTGGIDGGIPSGTLVQDSQGNLYGVTAEGGDLACGVDRLGCGTVFEITTANIERVLYSFKSSKHQGDGSNPVAGLIFDGAGNLYGTTVAGGYSSGTVFELSPNPRGHWTETVLYRFCPDSTHCTDGSLPISTLVFDKQGNLYGTTFRGGIRNNGVVFELSPNGKGGYTENVIHIFAGGADGEGAIAGLAIDNIGNLYGTTLSGGVPCNGSVHGCGLVYKLSPIPDGWRYSVIHDFTGLDGQAPDSSLILDSAGNLYGTAGAGGLIGPCAIRYQVGQIGCGTVFELSPGGARYIESVLYRFAGGNDGANPAYGLAIDSSGNLYGTTQNGGGLGCFLGGCGTAFELVLQPGGGWQEIVLNRFDGANGATPEAGLTVQSNPPGQAPLGKKGCIGNCYGSCTHGGTGNSGVVFQLVR